MTCGFRRDITCDSNRGSSSQRATEMYILTKNACVCASFTSGHFAGEEH